LTIELSLFYEKLKKREYYSLIYIGMSIYY